MESPDPTGASSRTAWMRFGFLIADLFTALAMLFLVANTQAHVVAVVPTPTPTSTPSPTATPAAQLCGLEQQPGFQTILTVQNDGALRALDHSAEADFANQVQTAMASEAQRSAGLVEVYGGSYAGSQDVGDGTALADGAIAALRSLSAQHIIFSTDKTLYQPFWSGKLASNQVQLIVFFYHESSAGQPCSV